MIKYKVNYYNIKYKGKKMSVADLQKQYSFTNGKINSYVYLRANDALEYAVRLFRKEKTSEERIINLDKIIWQCKECLAYINNPNGHYLFETKEGGVLLDVFSGIECELKLQLINNILKLDFQGAINIATKIRILITEENKMKF